MSNLNRQPACGCCTTVRQYIANHYDPSGLLTGTESPYEHFDHYLKLGESDSCETDETDVIVADFEAYLTELREQHT
jgi:hypothetical protein